VVILGIDPGWDRCGWAKIRHQDQKPEFLEAGLVTTARSDSKALRLLSLFNQISAVCRREPKPDLIVLEEVHTPPLGYRISNLVEVGEARGVLLMAAAKNRVAVDQIHPLVAKKAITGNGRAKKEDVARFLKFLLQGVPADALDDTTDAIAIALAAAMTQTQSAFVRSN